MFDNLDLGMLLFILLFSEGIAIFHTIIFAGLVKKRLPQWFFFVLNPSLIAFAYLLNKQLAGYTFLFEFASIFALVIIAVVVGGIASFVIGLREALTSRKKFLSFLFGILMFVGFFTLKFYIVPIIFIFIIGSLFVKTHSGLFYYQGILPTSTVEGMAMGLIELQGTVYCKEKKDYLKSPISHQKCVGYTYKIEERTKDRDGDTHYSTIHREEKCCNFYLSDATGETKVLGDSISMEMIYEGDSYSSGSKRYTEHLLLPKEEVLLIGKATDDAQEGVCIVKEDIKNVFGLIPVGALNLRIKYQPLLNHFFLTTAIIAFFIAIILLFRMEIEGNQLLIDFRFQHLFHH